MERSGGEYARHAGADDGHMEALGHVERGQRFDRTDTGLLADQRAIRRRHLVADREVHRRLEHLVGRNLGHALASEEGGNDLESQGLDLGLVAQVGYRVGVAGQVGDHGGQRPAVSRLDQPRRSARAESEAGSCIRPRA